MNHVWKFALFFRKIYIFQKVNLFSLCVCICSVIGADAGNGIRVFLPDIGMFMASLSVWLLCRKLVQKRASEEMAQDNHDFELEEKVGQSYDMPYGVLKHTPVLLKPARKHREHVLSRCEVQLSPLLMGFIVLQSDAFQK